MAGVGGALYAGTLGSVERERFSFFESLPLLLLTVVGGIGTAAGAAVRRRASSAASRSPSPSGPSSPTSTGSCPARWASPSAATRTARCATSAARYAVLEPGAGRPRRPGGLAGRSSCVLAVTGAITGWGLVFGAVGSAGGVAPGGRGGRTTPDAAAGGRCRSSGRGSTERSPPPRCASSTPRSGSRPIPRKRRSPDEHARGRRGQRPVRRATRARRRRASRPRPGSSPG